MCLHNLRSTSTDPLNSQNLATTKSKGKRETHIIRQKGQKSIRKTTIAISAQAILAIRATIINLTDNGTANQSLTIQDSIQLMWKRSRKETTRTSKRKLKSKVRIRYQTSNRKNQLTEYWISHKKHRCCTHRNL